MALEEGGGEAVAEVGPQAAMVTDNANADAAAGKSATAAAGKPAAAAAVKAKKQPVAGEERGDRVLQKIAKLDIRGRITLAMRGTKEDRVILIRGSTKAVAIAVLECSKSSDSGR